MNRIFVAVKMFLKDRFNLGNEQENNFETIKSIEKGVEFRGINIWTLVFAIFVASVGLNVNSTAVIIGAMLISPLMGPIMGLGLSVGIYDFELLKRSFKNLSIAVVISVLTSATYFLISPLNEAQSELLARTTPTIYDVLIALFGGLAGIVAGATKEKGNAIPGVAIATALMPPLCTAGFGLATGNIYYFLGAFYLFFINAVMISLSTFLMVRFLKFPFKQNVDKNQSNIVKRYIYLITIITVLPSIYSAYLIIEQTIFEKNAQLFISKEFNFDKTQVVNKNLVFEIRDTSRIELILTGLSLDSNVISQIEKKMADYSLLKTKLIVKQGVENLAQIDMSQIKSGIIEEIYQKNELALKNKDEKIKLLENEVVQLKSNFYPVKEISEEVNAINPRIKKFSVQKTYVYNISEQKTDTILLIYLSARLIPSENLILKRFLQKRLNFEKIKIINE